MLLRPLLFAFSLCAASASADVLVVDPGGAGFTGIQAAVDAAADGDTLLIQTGTYAPVTITGKGLTLVGDVGATVRIEGGLLIEDTLPGQLVVLRNLRSEGDRYLAGGHENGLRLELARGPVRAEACVFSAKDEVFVEQPEFHPPHGRAAVFASAALDLALHACTLQAGAPGYSFNGGADSAGGHALEVEGSLVALHGCRLYASEGHHGGDLGVGAPGGHAVLAHEAAAFPGFPTRIVAHGNTFVGGDGNIDDFCLEAGNGGDGLRLLGSLTTAHLQANHFTPGVKGACGFLVPGTDGVEVATLGGASVQFLPGEERDLRVGGPVRELGTLTLELQGETGDAAFMLVSAAPAQAPTTMWSGVLLLQLPLLGAGVHPLGVVPAPGTLTLDVTVPLLPPGIEAVGVFMQSVFVDTASDVWLAAPGTTVLLDQGF